MELTTLTPTQPDNVEEAATIDEASVIIQAPKMQQELQPIKTKSKPAETIPNFAPIIQPVDTPKGIEQAQEQANQIVSDVFGQAILHTVNTDEAVRGQILETAKHVVEDKTNTIADAANLESKTQHFKKHEDACSCFGYQEKTTSKFHVKAMAFWVFILDTLYIFTLGYFIIAPITFILQKLKVVIKRVWLAVLLAVIIYILILTIPILTTWLVGLRK